MGFFFYRVLSKTICVKDHSLKQYDEWINIFLFIFGYPKFNVQKEKVTKENKQKILFKS